MINTYKKIGYDLYVKIPGIVENRLLHNADNYLPISLYKAGNSGLLLTNPVSLFASKNTIDQALSLHSSFIQL
ncbi:hypothetical protein CWM47_32645 [Spirosoma pollinicola]|uniref:Uncharacterized protein n=1 Tax=Spirosoma pollinicola TaxID=2057025 RepID=A0A2K8Z8H9_9BACT|nr:hypothetical protein CWM47_32645 [Spirosoma pollinicola]